MPAADAETGLHFICLGANIARQFEFVQNAWAIAVRFRRPAERERSAARHARAGTPTARRPTASRCRAPMAPPTGITGLPQFVTVLGGAYFFLPGIRALRFLASSP